MKGIILISAYNAENTLADVLNDLQVFTDLHILIVDDGSTDKTQEIATSFGVKTLSHKKNLGKGAALQTGFKFASKLDIDFVITFDADKQHPVDYIPKFIEVYKNHPNDVIVGTRKRDKNMPITRKFSNYISAFLISARMKYRLYDVQCGFRLIPKKYLTWHLSNIKGFIFESEVLIALANNGVKFQSISIPTIYSKEYKSKMTYVDSTFGFIFMLISSLFKTYKQD
jgi:glycosyltransferase involved in cell wall biosynthesis